MRYVGWNDPGRGQDPWGRKGSSRPFDLDAFIQRLWRRMRRPGGAPPRWVYGVAALAAVAGWFVSGFYSVPQGDRGVLLQFGQEQRIVKPGAHWRWPAPIASDRIVSIRQVHIVAIGYQRKSTLYEGEPAPVQASMLTRDRDIVNLEFAVQYRVDNPSHYLFSVDHPRKTVARAAEAALRRIIASTPTNVILTTGQHAIEATAKSRLQRILGRYRAGVKIVAFKIQKAAPPKAVMAALQKVVRAREAAQRQQTQAEAYANGILPKAKADAATLIDKARAYRATAIARAKGRAARFVALAKLYKAAPVITRERLYIDAMARVYRKSSKILLTNSAHAVIQLPLTRSWSLRQGKGVVAPVSPKP